PVDRLLRVHPPTSVNDAGGEQRPIERDLQTDHARPGNITEEREDHGHLAHHLGRGVLPALGEVDGRPGGNAVELHEALPATVEASLLQLLGGESLARVTVDARIHLHHVERLRRVPGGVARLLVPRVAATTGGNQQERDQQERAPPHRHRGSMAEDAAALAQAAYPIRDGTTRSAAVVSDRASRTSTA